MRPTLLLSLPLPFATSGEAVRAQASRVGPSVQSLGGGSRGAVETPSTQAISSATD
jgi:hypothetical protein